MITVAYTGLCIHSHSIYCYKLTVSNKTHFFNEKIIFLLLETQLMLCTVNAFLIG